MHLSSHISHVCINTRPLHPIAMDRGDLNRESYQRQISELNAYIKEIEERSEEMVKVKVIRGLNSFIRTHTD